MDHLAAHHPSTFPVPLRRAVYMHGRGRRGIGHEAATHEAVARRLAALLDLPYGGFRDAVPPLAPVYLVPDAPLSGTDVRATFALRDENDLFGGWVPEAWMATKAIVHPLVSDRAAAPAAWTARLAEETVPLTLQGFTAFSTEDAVAAARHLLRAGPARLKCANADGGQGQFVVHDDDELSGVLGALGIGGVLSDVLAIEENLEDVVTYSVGQVRLPGRLISYFGTQSTTPDNDGRAAYGGSSLFVVRGGFDRLLARDLPEETAEAVRRAVAFDALADRHVPGFIASRRNYDVACGVAPDGAKRIGVLEQSWRMGGATGAEIAALERFAADPRIAAVRARAVEVFGEPPDLPTDAAVYFSGCDPRMGPMTKYACVEETIEG